MGGLCSTPISPMAPQQLPHRSYPAPIYGRPMMDPQYMHYANGRRLTPGRFPMKPSPQHQLLSGSHPTGQHRDRRDTPRQTNREQVYEQPDERYTPQNDPVDSALPSAPRSKGATYSKCTGRKIAVCVGINYIGQRRELRGCVNDARNVRNFLMNHGFQSKHIALLTDEAKDPRKLPTRKNIMDAMYWLVNGAKANDSLFFHFSGHGQQVRDREGDEVDGYDEAIFPSDYRQSGLILDEEIHAIMVKDLPSGCRLMTMFDSCHSGTALDLPYVYSADGRLKGNYLSRYSRTTRDTAGDVISLSGCQDSETSADTNNGVMAVGAMSDAFITTLTHNPDQTYQQLLQSIRDIIRQHYPQKPQLASSQRINTTLRFMI